MLSAIIPYKRSNPAMLLVKQLVYHRFILSNPFVLGLNSFNFKIESYDTYELIKMIGPSFGGKDHVLGPYTALDVRANDNYELVAYTNGLDKRLMSYSKDDGAFQYTNHRWNGIRVVTASCQVFDD